MKLTVIGCAGGYPYQDRATSSYLIQNSEGGHPILLDAGSGSLRSLEKIIDPTLVKTLIVSHDHADHTADVGAFQHVAMLRQSQAPSTPLTIYCHDQSQYAKLLMENESNHLQYYGSKTVIHDQSYVIRFQKTNHPIECYAMRIQEVETQKVIVYTADSASSEDLVEFSSGADLLLADCNFLDEEGENDLHMTASQLAKLANEAKVKQVVPVHIPPQTDHALMVQQIMASLNRDISLLEAYQGAVYEV